MTTTTPSTRTGRRRRRGFTLAEMALAVTITLLVLAVALPFIRAQARTLETDAGRNDATQMARYTQNFLDRELRNAGIGVVDLQPIVVQADSLSVTFNADLTSNLSTDAGAVFYDPDEDTLAIRALDVTRRLVLPNSSTYYPDSTYYLSPGVPSGAETISYWARKDSTSGRSDEYVIWRRVNDRAPRLIARGIQIKPGESLFQYWREKGDGSLDTIPKSQLPIYWKTAGHIADSIRTIRTVVRGIYHGRKLVKNDTMSISRTIDAKVALLNTGLVNKTTCGEIPLPVTAVTTTMVLDSLGAVKYVRTTWGRSIDELAGEKDIERYSIYRRKSSSASWGSPIANVPKSGLTTYTYDDFNRTSGWRQYAVAAQDCSPANSPVTVGASVNLP